VVQCYEVGLTPVHQTTGIIIGAILLPIIFLIDESYPPVLLARKANRLRVATQNWALHAKSQETGTDWRHMARTYLMVPFEMLVDPICFSMNLYTAFVYAIIFLWVFCSTRPHPTIAHPHARAITAFSIEFQRVRIHAPVRPAPPH
jgi:hypothetical protein